MVSAQEWLHSWKYRQSRSRVLSCIVMFYLQLLVGTGLKPPHSIILLVGVITYVAVWIVREGVTKKEAAYHVFAIALVSATVACIHVFNVNYWIAVGALLAGLAAAGAIKKIASRGKEVL